MLRNKIESFLKDDKRKFMRINGTHVRKYVSGETISVETADYSIEHDKKYISGICDRLIEKFAHNYR